MNLNPIIARNAKMSCGAEASLLGAVLLRGSEVIDRVNLPAEAFYDPRHREVWVAMCSMQAKYLVIDPITLEAELAQNGKLAAVGGLSFISDLLDEVPTADNAEYYAGLIRRAWLSRQVVGALSEVLNSSEDGDDLLQLALVRLGELKSERPLDVASLDQLVLKKLNEVSKRAENPAYGPKRIPTGFRGIDRIIGGVPMGVISLLSAPTRIGKSSLVRGMALNMTANGYPGLYISAEDESDIVAERSLASESMVANWRINHVALNAEELQRVSIAADKLYRNAKNLYVCDRLCPSSEYCLLVRRMRSLGIKFVILDYLQQIDEPDAEGNEYRSVNISLANFTQLAKDEGIAVLLVSQLNRGNDGKDIKVNQMRGSGRIEEKVRLLMALQRDEDSSEAKVRILKNSHGRHGECDLVWDGDSVSYRDVAYPGEGSYR